MHTKCPVAFFALTLSIVSTGPAVAAGDPIRGARLFNTCASCHTVRPGEHLTGPSLAGIWGRKAGEVPGFERYSDALARSGIVWSEASLEKWLASPEKLVPGTTMPFPGLREKNDRADVIAFLKAAAEGKAPSAGTGPGGMMMGRARSDLKQAPAEGQVTAIEHCHDSYTIRTADGTTEKVWEFNVRLKTDSSKDGPLPGRPVVVGSGMRGDRVSVIFASPAEISRSIKQCG